MSEIIQALTENKCSLHESKGVSNVIKCSKSFVQKFPDRPWTVMVKKDSLLDIKEKLLDTGNINVSGISMGGIEDEGAWSKIKTYNTGRYANIYIFDEDLMKSNVKDSSLIKSIKRMGRLARNASSDKETIDISEMARKELDNISINIERTIEDAYSKGFKDDVICKATPDVKRIWTPRNNDMLQFQVSVTCMLPREVTDDLKDDVESVGQRSTFKTSHRSGINSILTPDESLFLRKIVVHDRDLGGPFLAFGVRDRKIMRDKSFIDNINMLEEHLSKI